MNGIDDVRLLLPAWIGWTNAAWYCLIAFLLSFCCASINTWAAVRPLRRCQSQFWVERARLAYPARVIASLNVVILPVMFWLLAFEYTGLLSHWPPRLVAFLGGVAAWAAALLVRIRLERTGGITSASVMAGWGRTRKRSSPFSAPPISTPSLPTFGRLWTIGEPFLSEEASGAKKEKMSVSV
jgi:hypothetical protein